MPRLEPLVGDERWAYETMARKLNRVLALLDDATVVQVVANAVFRVALHGAQTATAEHQVPSALARGIAAGLFHARAVLRESFTPEDHDG